MKAAVQYAPFDVRVEDVPEPEPAAGQIKVEIAYCGICGTDPEIYEGRFGLMKTAGWPEGPKIEGHEASGTIVSLGSDLQQGYEVGQRVAMNFRSYCGACYYCRNKREHFCEHVTHASGAFAEYAVYNESAIYALADDVSFEVGALLEPLTVALHAIDQADIQPGNTVAIFGAGPIGLLALELAIRAGAARVLVSDPIASKREIALRLGADIAADPSTEDVEEVGRAMTEGRGFDQVIEASGNLAAAKQAIALADFCGTIVWVGVYDYQKELSISPFYMYQRELTIRAAMISPYSFPRSVNLLSKLELEPLISNTYPLAEIVKAFDDHRNSDSIKTLIRP